MRLDTAVTQLQQQPDGTIRVTAAPAATVLADSDTSVSSTVYIADRVIVTVPLALLQRNVISFTPPLSAVKQRAINGLGAGECAKVVLTFKEAFWPQEMSFSLPPMAHEPHPRTYRHPSAVAQWAHSPAHTSHVAATPLEYLPASGQASRWCHPPAACRWI